MTNTLKQPGIWALFSLSATIFFLPGQSALADALDNWTPSLIVTNPPGYMGSVLSGLAHGNGRYVAVGSYSADDSGVVQVSLDGMNWARLPYYALLDLYDVAFGNGTFVASGWDYYQGANLYNSTNGFDWASHSNATVANFFGVAYGGGLFVAVGDGLLPNTLTFTNRQIYTSPDGITWTGRRSGSADGDIHTIYAVACGSGVFVAVGGGYVYTSTNATTWTRSYSANAGDTVSYCNGLFIIPSGPGANLVSTDGSTWSLVMNNTSSTFGRVIYNNRLYVAVAGWMLFTSLDATNWDQRSVPTPAT